jgi:hypothetical protein
MVYDGLIVGPDGRVLRSSRKATTVSAAVPELHLHVGEDGDLLTFRLSVGDPALGRFDVEAVLPRLRRLPGQLTAELFHEIEGLGRRPDVGADEKLRVKGLRLGGELVPVPIRERLVELAGKGHVLRLTSDEPTIPWELVALPVAAGSGDISFLCEAFAVSRETAAGGLLSEWVLRKAAVVIGADLDIEEPTGERDDLVELMESRGCPVELISPTRKEVREAMSSGSFDLLHFVGHGWAHRHDADLAAFQLSPSESLEAEDLVGTPCRVRMVFLNACQTARGGWGWTRPAGWATRFREAGAAAFLGAFWSVSDRSARRFSSSVYRRLLDGEPFAVAVQKARFDLGRGDANRLAYVAHGDPQGRFRVSS